VISARQLRWAVLLLDLDPSVGHEQGGQRRSLVVSYEAYHTSTMLTVCPITARRGEPKYPNEVAIPVGEAGQTKPGVILCHQVRTVSLLRARPMLDSGIRVHYVTDTAIRRSVRGALIRQLGLDIPADEDGAAGD
jgi:mRNA-degrading endonuclease toxin of MazEF toxin-antitoxin module